MTQSRYVSPAPSGHSRSAVGRLTVLVDEGAGTEKVTYERRWPDARAARAWCEQKIDRTHADAVILEIQVTEEVWGHANPWDATANRQVPESLQLGLRTRTGEVVWGTPRGMGNQLSRRRQH
jgi:hypothetical protein